MKQDPTGAQMDTTGRPPNHQESLKTTPEPLSLRAPTEIETGKLDREAPTRILDTHTNYVQHMYIYSVFIEYVCCI